MSSGCFIKSSTEDKRQKPCLQAMDLEGKRNFWWSAPVRSLKKYLIS